MVINQQVQNPPSAAYIISLIGGILSILGGIVLIGLGALVGLFTFGIGFFGYGVLGIWMIICGAVIIFAASQLKEEPMEHTKWGAIILVFSIIGGWSILDFIGGILALVYTPIPAGAYGAPQPYAQQPQQYYQPQQPSPQQITRICPSCGRVVNESIKFCPHCGKQLG